MDGALMVINEVLKDHDFFHYSINGEPQQQRKYAVMRHT
jgi:hypothetical protein